MFSSRAATDFLNSIKHFKNKQVYKYTIGLLITTWQSFKEVVFVHSKLNVLQFTSTHKKNKKGQHKRKKIDDANTA